jgi:nickel-type superoxide dismutase maturation protease
MRIAALSGSHPHFLFMLREANWKDRVLYALGRRRAFRVQGDSMSPTVKDGEVVMISPKASVEPGDIVLAKHPYKQSVKMLKRIESIDENGEYSLVGDNPGESTDSRTFGTVAREYIDGKAICRVK